MPVVRREPERQQLLPSFATAPPRPGRPRGCGRTRPASQQDPGSPSATGPPARASRRRRRSRLRSSRRRGHLLRPAPATVLSYGGNLQQIVLLQALGCKFLCRHTIVLVAPRDATAHAAASRRCLEPRARRHAPPQSSTACLRIAEWRAE